jgi:hypothetical protein
MDLRSPASAEDKLRGGDGLDFHFLGWAEGPWALLNFSTAKSTNKSGNLYENK